MDASPSNSRRKFLKVTALTGVGTIVLPVSSWAGIFRDDDVWITILHTNDMHSQIDPFSESDKNYPGKGGMAKRAALIKSIREENPNVLLLDAGDVFQGTPYFNFYGGELEFTLMSEMKYDAATMGNHDFDNGLEGFKKMLPHANFPFICSNYDFSNTILKDKTEPYQVFKKNGIRIGVYGLGVELQGLVSKLNYGETIYRDPITVANEMALFLKEEKNCDLVICLSHLGYSYKSSKISDCTLAAQSKNTDIIIGGHTHTFLDEPVLIPNADGKDVIVNQAGWAGLRLGRIDIKFQREKTRNLSKNFTYIYKGNTEIG